VDGYFNAIARELFDQSLRPDPDQSELDTELTTSVIVPIALARALDAVGERHGQSRDELVRSVLMSFAARELARLDRFCHEPLIPACHKDRA
jgi:hypothetical protein